MAIINNLLFVLISGSALMNIVGVYKEIQDQHMNIVRFYQNIFSFFS